MTSALRNKSIAYWYPDREKHRCGYCKNDYGSISNGMWTETLTVEDYQNLIDRGWRRSGKYCYKPIMQETCCPQYSIRCDTINFSLSKSQKKVIKKFNRYLEDGILLKNDIQPDTQGSEVPDGPEIFMKDKPDINFSTIDNPNQVPINDTAACSTSSTSGEQPYNNRIISECQDSQQVLLNSHKRPDSKNTYKEGVGADLSKPPCKKAKLLRLERKKEKCIKNGLSLEKKESLQAQKSLKQFLRDFPKQCKHKLRLELVPTSSPGIKWDQVKDVEFDLYRKYQMIVHNDPPSKLTMKGFHRFLVNSPLLMTLERMSLDHELFAVSAKLFEKYQTIIHNEPKEESDPDQFYSFLVETPLEPTDFRNGANGPGYGSFHQQYWIDDKLVAVGVIDILPRCVSSVYFFYDPDYRNLTLGTYGALREVQFTKSLQEKIPELKHYYMGFYIHSCQKMRYKGKLVPSYLLCPETYHWVPIEKCLSKLDVSKYSRLEDDVDATDENYPKTKDIDDMKVIYNHKFMNFRQYKRQHSEDQGLFTNIGILIGKQSMRNIIFCKSYF